ncbi:hypothetical protein Tco_0352448 [Tanacetum coccineum]
MHNVVAFLEKPGESDGFAEIIDFLKASSVHYALTVNPTIYTSCIEQFWVTEKAKMVNDVRQIQALIDKNKLIITETSIRSDLYLEDAGGTNCLPTATIFEELARMGVKSTAWNEFSSTMASLIICLATNQKLNLSKYIFDAMVKHLHGGRKEAEIAHDETEHEESIPTPSNDLLPSDEDSMQLNDLMVLCTKLQKQVLDLEKAKYNQAIEIASLKKRVDKLEKRSKFRTIWLKRLKKVGATRRNESSNDSLGAQEDASKQGRRIKDINADAEVTLVNETQERQDEDLMFDTRVLDGDEMFVDATTGDKDEHSTKIDDSTAGETVTTVGVEDSTTLTIQVSTTDIGVEGVTAAKIDELTLAQTLIEIKAAKPKVVITVATTTTTTRPKARGVVVQEPNQVALDEDLAKNIQAQLDVEIIEEERLERQKQEEANISLIELWENTQAMMEADRLLAERL